MLRTAVVAMQPPRIFVIHHVCRTRATIRHPAAMRAVDHRRVATAILEQQTHVSARQCGVHCLRHRFAQTIHEVGLRGIDELHLGQLRAGDCALMQHMQAVAAGLRVLPRFQ